MRVCPSNWTPSARPQNAPSSALPSRKRRSICAASAYSSAAGRPVARNASLSSVRSSVPVASSRAMRAASWTVKFSRAKNAPARQPSRAPIAAAQRVASQNSFLHSSPATDSGVGLRMAPKGHSPSHRLQTTHWSGVMAACRHATREHRPSSTR